MKNKEKKNGTLKISKKSFFKSGSLAVVFLMFLTVLAVGFGSVKLTGYSKVSEQILLDKISDMSKSFVSLSLNSIENKDNKNWNDMMWSSEILPVSVLINGRSHGTAGLSNADYVLYNKSNRFCEDFLQRILLNKVKFHTETLGKMFQVAWNDGETIALLIPSVRDQYSIGFFSSQIMVFPDGLNNAKMFWREAAPDLVAKGSPLSFSDLLW